MELNKSLFCFIWGLKQIPTVIPLLSLLKTQERHKTNARRGLKESGMMPELFSKHLYFNGSNINFDLNVNDASVK